MKNIIKIFIAVLIVSCNNPKKEKNSKQLDPAILAETTGDTALNLNTQKDRLANLPINANPIKEEPEECVFDQKNQTDEFLKNVKELKGYKWDYEKRTATFLLETGDTLFIYRGGCNHFVVEAEFRLRNDKTDYSKWSNVYKKALWIAKVLDQEFAYKELKQDIDNNKVTLEKYEQTRIDEVRFSNQLLQEREYAIEREIEPDVKIIKLSYTII